VFIPYAVDAPFDRRPVVNWLVLGVLVLVFALQVVTSEKEVAEAPIETIESPIDAIEIPTTAKERIAKKRVEEERGVTGPMARFVLDGWGIGGLFGHIWLHTNIVCLIGSLIFLWPFGNAVCSKLGNGFYLLFYLLFGLLGGISHLLFGGGAAVGACAAISGVVGMYIAFFPENSISCFFFVPHPVTLGISGYWVVLLWFVFDIVASLMSGQNIMCGVHIGCFMVGLGVAILALKKNWVVMEKDEKSLLQMLRREKKEEEKEKKEEVEKENGRDVEAAAKRPKVVGRERSEPARKRAEAEKPADEYIRFRCQCGFRIKVHKKNAGKAGRCPKCSRWVEAPRE